jgi:hypothetical protein
MMALNVHCIQQTPNVVGHSGSITIFGRKSQPLHHLLYLMRFHAKHSEGNAVAPTLGPTVFSDSNGSARLAFIECD